MSQTEEFVAALFAHVPEPLSAMLWTQQDKKSHWFAVEHTDLLAARAAELAGEYDVYVGASVARSPGGAYRRIEAKAAAGIMGVWADIDIADPDIHKKWNLPPDEASARQIMTEAGLEPTIIVHSGHGLQAWWLFAEFWEFESEEDRREAAALSQAWNMTLRVRAAAHDWIVDSTFDLSRVMRVPGTINLKAEPVPVQLLEIHPERRYTASDFEEFVVDERALRDMGLNAAREYVVGLLNLNAEANPPFDRFAAMIANDPQFQRSWERERRDIADQSASSYDLSLASIAVQAGWNDQEIVDLLIASRRKNGDDLKLRQDYYGRTLAKAHETIARTDAMERVDEVTEDMKRARRSGDEDQLKDVRRAALDSISEQFGIEVIRFIKYGSTPPSYRLETAVAGIDLGDASDVLSWAKVRSAIMGGANRLIERMKPAAWDNLVQLMLEVCEEIDTGLESTESGQVFVWVSEYLMNRPPIDDPDKASVNEYPYIDREGRLCIFVGSFKRWLWLSKSERLKARELNRMMSNVGCEPAAPNFMVDGVRTTRSLWRMPPELGPSPLRIVPKPPPDDPPEDPELQMGTGT